MEEALPANVLSFPSLWDHFTMFGFFEEDKKAIDDVLKELLAVPVEAATAARR